MFQAVNILSGPAAHCGPRVQKAWEFEHPRKDVVLDAQGGRDHMHFNPQLMLIFVSQGFHSVIRTTLVRRI